MNNICATQIKAARALLGLSQEELASQTGLSITTIRKIENGEISPRSATINAIRCAVENAGWEFIYPEGIRRRQNNMIIYDGINSTDLFFDDMLDTVKKKGGEIYGSFVSQDMFFQSIGAHDKNYTGNLAKLNEAACIKGLVSEQNGISVLLPHCQFRTAQKRHMNAIPYFIYGDKQAVVIPDGKEHFQYYVIRNMAMAQKYRMHFLDLWNEAIPFLVQSNANSISHNHT